jgi:hypothetical protein
MVGVSRVLSVVYGLISEIFFVRLFYSFARFCLPSAKIGQIGSKKRERIKACEMGSALPKVPKHLAVT